MASIATMSTLISPKGQQRQRASSRIRLVAASPCELLARPQRRSAASQSASSSHRSALCVRAFAPSSPNSSSMQQLAAFELASYSLHRRQPTTAPWFQKAVRQIVRRVDDSPFMQLVNLHDGGERASLSSFSIDQAVVEAPELWQAVAQHVSNSVPDVVVLVQQVSLGAKHCPQAAMDEAAAAAAEQQQADVRVRAEDACRQLVASGVAESIFTGSVGDCCESETESDDELFARSRGGGSSGAVPVQPAAGASAVLPFLTHSRRRPVRAAALGPAPTTSHFSHPGQAYYWGLVVQSRGSPTGVEGAYLLKTVRSSAATGCTCTHYSLTRICQGEAPERQFLRSWLV